MAVLISTVLAWTAAQFQSSVATITHQAESRAVASELALSLLMYQRIGNLYVVTREPERDATRDELASQMRRLLADAQNRASSTRERQLLDDLSTRLAVYLQHRKRLESSEIPLREIVRQTRPELSRALQTLQLLRNFDDARVQQANAAAARASRLSRRVGLGAGLLIVLGLVAGVLSVNRYLVRPILGLHQTVARLRAGHDKARADENGFREVRELARGLNEMADTLAHQRSDQLAFLAGVAHDLRNPLAGLKIGFLGLEQEQSESRRIRTRAILERQIDRLARMVGDLLDATRIEAGNLELCCEDLDLRDVVEDMVRLYGPTSPDHQIALTVPHDPVIVHGDPLRLEQVVSNLLSNAIKFSPAGGPVDVTVWIEHDDTRLVVTDQGVGIPREKLADLFRPFSRHKPEVAPGAGLGLSVVRRIVVAHRGEIDVESTEGAGASFIVRLPLAR